ncbi:hypothetical protein ACWGET_30010 [Streptomyces zaomyceticus]
MYEGAACTLYPGPFNSRHFESIFGGPGEVRVTTSATSFTFEVVGKGYFDDRGSTITFSIEEQRKSVYLRQDGVTTGSKAVPTIGVNVFSAAKREWGKQAYNLQRLIYKERYGIKLKHRIDPNVFPQGPNG